MARSINPLEVQYWFHDVISEDKAKQLLVYEGDFLVRRIVRGNKTIVSSRNMLGTDDEEIIEGDHDWKPDSSKTLSEFVGDMLDNAQLKFPIVREKYLLDDIVLADEIGEGHFAKVFKATYKPKRKEVAVKIYKGEMTDDQKKKFLLEGFILGQNYHPNIVEFIGFGAGRKRTMIAMEYLEEGDLLNFLKKRENDLTRKQLIKMCQDVASGMRYLVDRNFIHRDLAARNCMVTCSDDLTVKISDFGMSRMEKEYYMPSSDSTVLMWTAPETIITGKYTSESDVWSFGILMWEVFSRGAIPYAGLEAVEKTCFYMYYKLKSGHRMEAPEKETPAECYQLMKKCWDFAPKHRYNFKKIQEELQTIFDKN